LELQKDKSTLPPDECKPLNVKTELFLSPFEENGSFTTLLYTCGLSKSDNYISSVVIGRKPERKWAKLGLPIWQKQMFDLSMHYVCKSY